MPKAGVPYDASVDFKQPKNQHDHQDQTYTVSAVVAEALPHPVTPFQESA
jgi:hypothetical protein